MSAGRLWAVVGATVAIYLFVLLLLRVSGRRQLAELTVIDLVVVLVLGSAVETAMSRGDTSLAAGLVAAATLLVTNRLLTMAMLRSKRFRHVVGGGPVLLVHNGKVLDEHLRRSGVSRDDLAAALRARGNTNPERVRFAVLETDGTITVVDRDAHGRQETTDPL